MGDLQVWTPQPDGFLAEESLFPPLSSSSSSNSHPLSIGAGSWLRAEQTTQEIICWIQPTIVSEHRRKEVIDYVQRLIRGYLGGEVFPFGSVPLKTYLPDGDIDLTAVSSQNGEDSLASDVRAVLEGEEQSKTAEFHVKDVQYIHAEVKLVKCIIQNIVVDISFNRLGGLYTLCFLEQVDHLIGKNHLFKRSIILIKAWCYHESRILGAHHGLISTYALETLVLYIFHLFHASLNGPLSVLYRFLDYFSKFDWDSYCISLNGPVCISSLPELVAETPENGGCDLLLSKAFLKRCMEMFSVPSRVIETNSRAFPKKYLNIVDPLKENNNLGRSVSKANFYRIRSAFTYGARKLGRILLLPIESIADEVNKFFMNTLERHGSGQRPDVQDLIQDLDDYSSLSGIEPYAEGKTVLESPPVDSSRKAGESTSDPQEFLCKGINNIEIYGTERKSSPRIANEPQRHPMKFSSLTVSVADDSAIGNAVSGYRLAGDANDLATSRIQGLRVTDQTSKSSPPSKETDTSPLGKAHHAPHLNSYNAFTENVEIGNGNQEQTKPSHSGISENKVWCGLSGALDEETEYLSWQDLEENQANNEFYSYNNYEGRATVGSTDGLLISCPIVYPSEDLCLGYREKDTAGNPQDVNSLLDLSGDYDNHLRSLLYGQWCRESALNAPVLPMPPLSASQLWNKNGWNNNLHRPVQYNGFSRLDADGFVPGQPFYPVNPSVVSGTAFGVEEISKPRGTGTYFPNMNHHPNRERPSTGSGRNHGSATYGQSQRSPRHNGRVVNPPETNWHDKGRIVNPPETNWHDKGRIVNPPETNWHDKGRVVNSPETNWHDKGSYKLSQAQFPVLPSRGKPGSSNAYQPCWPASRRNSYANGFSHPCDRLEFGSLGPLQLDVPLSEASRQPDSGASQAQVSMSTLPSSAMQSPKPVPDVNPERVAEVKFHLKDEGDFPPLSPMKMAGRDHL